MSKEIETIQIAYMKSPVADSRANRGVTQTIKDAKVIIDTLSNEDNHTDDDYFYDANGNFYSIDELIGKTVEVQGQTVLVPNS